MSCRCELARAAVRRALSFRAENSIDLENPCDVYELIVGQHLDLQFVDIPSLEGMYLDELESKRICVCSHRPFGRQRFTAAHELGHYVFLHGSRVDNTVEEQCSAESAGHDEWTADLFASYLLMPPRAVQRAFRLRNADPARADAQNVFKAACWLGVGYGTLVNQMALSLGILPAARRQQLLRTTPKAVKHTLYGDAVAGDLWPLDEVWSAKRVHAQVGDIFLGLNVRQRFAVPTRTLLAERRDGAFEAVGVGEGSALLNSGGSVRISVSRRAYIGFFEYRYLPE